MFRKYYGKDLEVGICEDCKKTHELKSSTENNPKENDTVIEA